MILDDVRARSLRKHKEQLRAHFATVLERATVFVTAYERLDQTASATVAHLEKFLLQRFVVTICDVKLHSHHSEETPAQEPGTCISAFVVKDASGEQVKRVLEGYFLSRLPKEHQDTHRIRLPAFGQLLPMNSDLSCYSFAHGVGHYYRYRLDKNKLKRVATPLRAYLLKLPSICPNDRFLSGPRASNLGRPISITLEHRTEHACIGFARQALENRRFKSAHEDVEKFMVENDYSCVASEIPIWLEAEEMQAVGLTWTQTSGWLTGHIDVLRCEDDGAIWIWDYKPEARLETTAHIQVYLYAIMLSKRTGIPLHAFKCGYFDTADAFLFSPASVKTEFGQQPEVR